jgi:DNA polymerase elongation subunit (family B)
MKLEFEPPVYERYLMLSKKRYLIITSDREGNLSTKPKKKGVMSVRRGYATFCKGLYDTTAYKILQKGTEEECMELMLEGVFKLLTRQVGIDELVVTTSMNVIEGYKKKPVPQEKEDRELFLAKKGYHTEDQFHIGGLPAHVQLGLKIRSRGGICEEGSRIPWIILNKGESARTAKKCYKIEDPLYFLKRRDVLRIDYINYVKQLVNPFDELCETVWKKKNVFTCLYKQILLKEKVCAILNVKSTVRVVGDVGEDRLPRGDTTGDKVVKKRLTGFKT